MPLDPEGLARLRAAEALRRQEDSGPRRVVLQYLAHPLGEVSDPQALARALERRALALDALSARAEPAPGGVVRLELEVAQLAWRTLFEAQLGRRGELWFAAVDPACDPFKNGDLEAGVLRGREHLRLDGGLTTFLYTLPGNGHSVSSRAVLERATQERVIPEGRRIVLGPVRLDNGDVAWRTYCVTLTAALLGPSFDELEPTLDRATLLPLLRARFEEASRPGWSALARRDLAGILSVIDGEAQPARYTPEGARAGRVELMPRSRSTGFSPEVLAALFRSGALPVALRLEWLPGAR